MQSGSAGQGSVPIGLFWLRVCKNPVDGFISSSSITASSMGAYGLSKKIGSFSNLFVPGTLSALLSPSSSGLALLLIS